MYGTAVADEIAAVKEKARTDSATVLSMVASASAVHAKNSEGNVLGEMLRDMGCVNIADSNEMLLENLSIEYIVQCDPDYIFFVQRGDDEEGMRAYVDELLGSNPAWNSLTAVQEGRV
jgi:iron complex transport system substrate-binding protein